MTAGPPFSTIAGVAYARRQQQKEAIEDFNRAIQLYPNTRPSTTIAATCSWVSARCREAIKDFDRALVLAPGYAAAYSNRAGAYIKLGQVERALADYRSIDCADPQQFGRRSTGAAGRTSPPIDPMAPSATSRAPSASMPASGAAYRSRAEAKMAIERHEEAIEDYSRAVAFEPRNAEIYALRGWAYLEADNAASGVKDFARAIELNPNVAAFYAARGFAYAKAEAYDDALNDFARAIELEPRSPKAYAYRAWTYRRQQQPELGSQGRRARSEARCQQRGSALGARARSTRRWGVPELAVADLRKGVALEPRLKAAAQALDRLGVGTRTSEAGGRRTPAFERWRVYQKGRQFVASNDEFPRLKVNLEMMGKGQPRILEWDVKKPPFAGIAVLRFHAGVVDGPRAPRRSSTRPSSTCSRTPSCPWWCSGKATSWPSGPGTTASSPWRAPTASPTSSSCARASRPRRHRLSHKNARPIPGASPRRYSSSCSAGTRRVPPPPTKGRTEREP